MNFRTQPAALHKLFTVQTVTRRAIIYRKPQCSAQTGMPLKRSNSKSSSHIHISSFLIYTGLLRTKVLCQIIHDADLSFRPIHPNGYFHPATACHIVIHFISLSSLSFFCLKYNNFSLYILVDPSWIRLHLFLLL